MHLSGVTGAAAPHQLTVLRRRLKGRVVSSDLLARVPTACLIRDRPSMDREIQSVLDQIVRMIMHDEFK